MPVELEAMGPEWQRCDSCSAKAQIKCYLPFGALNFCRHHYNKHSEALIAKGGRAVRYYEPIGPDQDASTK